MQYISTRDKARSVSGAQAVIAGLAPDGGLFVPGSFPALEGGLLSEMASWPYARIASWVLRQYFDDIPASAVEDIAARAYGAQFDDNAIAPLTELFSGQYLLELYHGPTLAFKDMALQALPGLMLESMRLTGEKREVCILVATSGDTGKAALDGFKDVSGTRIAVCYPASGVSAAQKRQMVTQEGGNVFVLAVEGNFDDAQTGVKRIFADASIAGALDKKGIRLSSANSINWGRLAPQIAYYIYAYTRLAQSGLRSGEHADFVVPTGNFGNILAAYYARRMGLPIRRLVCASNANRVLHDFFETGEYNSRRTLYPTLSPSMDILISSNLERLLFEAAGRDDALVNGWMRSLRETGAFRIPPDIKAWMDGVFSAGWGDDGATLASIRRVFEQTGRLIDPHTAVAMHVTQRLRSDDTPLVIVATASPFKFAADVLEAIAPGEAKGKDEFAVTYALAKKAGCEVPERIAALEGKPVLHTARCAPEGIESELMRWLNN